MVQVMQSLDGTKTIDEIGYQLHLKPSVIQQIIEQLAKHDLLEQEKQQEARGKQKTSRWRHSRMFFVHCDVITNDTDGRVYALLQLKYVFRFCSHSCSFSTYTGLMYLLDGTD